MVRKQYILTGPSFTFEENDEEEVLELNAKFENPRALRQVSVTHAGFTFDLGNSPPPQLYLRSKALAEYTTSSARELGQQGAETSSDVLGHVALVHAALVPVLAAAATWLAVRDQLERTPCGTQR